MTSMMNSRKSFFEKLRNFDAYPKTLEDFQIKTFSGATVTVVACVLTALLVASEFYDYVKPQIIEDLFVDTSRGARLKINLDIVFNRLPCDMLTLDAQDLSGEQHINIQHNIFKRPLNIDGSPKADPTRQDSIGPINSTAVNVTKAVETTTKPLCGSCYGAESEKRKCCDTCNDILEAYRAKGWATPDTDKFEQCKREGVKSSAKHISKEGCQVYGYLNVNRVGGNFHISPGNSYLANHLHIHEFHNYNIDELDLSHTIRMLSFGEVVVAPTTHNEADSWGHGFNSAPLNGYVHTSDTGLRTINYYLKIVPTLYQRLDGSTFPANQFSVTQLEKEKRSIFDNEVPGLFFSYDLSPMMVKYSEQPRSLPQLLTNLCAIIGGVFTVAGLVDSFIYQSSKALQKKLQIGKST